MNIIFYIDDGQHLHGHTQEITCIELSIFSMGFWRGRMVFVWQLRPARFGRGKHLSRGIT